jgi:mono/diheme cytochrome c family protein
MAVYRVMSRLLLGAALAVGVLGIGCQRAAPPPSPTLAATRTPQRPTPRPTATPLIEMPAGNQVARGEAVYAQQCASCHGDNLEGHYIGPALDRPVLLGAAGGTAVRPGNAARLYATIAQEMPYYKPGSLSSLD